MNLGDTALVWQYWNNKATAAELLAHLQQCDAAFVAALVRRTDLPAYTDKLMRYAERFEAWTDGQLAGVVALYCNATQTGQAYISHVSTLPAWQGQGMAKALLQRAYTHARMVGMTHIQLEVATDNFVALRLYQQQGFAATGQTTHTGQHLRLTL